MGKRKMRKRLALRIGITIGLRAMDESLWVNGVKQNALFLAKMFQHSPYGHEVVLLNTTDVEVTRALPWDLDLFPTYSFDEACDGLDVVIELGGQISAEQTKRIKAQGTRLISYCCGSEYVQNIEAMIFGRRLWEHAFINDAYDELWIIPQIWDLNRGFFQTFRQCQARQVPFVWDPMSLTQAMKEMPNEGIYRPRIGPKRLSIIEANINVLKFCLYPILIAEKGFREFPQDIEFLHVANAAHMANQGHEFTTLMQHLQIVKAHKASFVGWVKTPEFLSHHTDVVISHQWGCPLNYFYLECCWMGYPVIHNAELIPELGYYYPGHDLDIGCKQLEHVLKNHDKNHENYIENQRLHIQRFLATDPVLTQTYDLLLFEVMK